MGCFSSKVAKTAVPSTTALAVPSILTTDKPGLAILPDATLKTDNSGSQSPLNKQLSKQDVKVKFVEDEQQKNLPTTSSRGKMPDSIVKKKSSTVDETSDIKRSSSESAKSKTSSDTTSASLRVGRQKSVTGLDSEGSSETTPKTRIASSRHLRKQSGLHEGLVPLNQGSEIRDFYSGVDDGENTIGSGNWGVVRVVTRIRDGRKFACKIVRLDENMTDAQFMELRDEIDALRQLDHVAIARLYETFERPGEYLYLIMELLTGGELYTALVERSPTGRFDEIRTRRLAKHIVSAIAYLHDKGLVHRDIKLENFCFRGEEDEDEIVLIDFGLARLHKAATTETEVVGSSYYIAPEIIEGSYSGPTPDMWSIGVILFMMLAGRPPFDGSSDQNIMRRIVKGKYNMDDEVWKNETSIHAQDFVRRCLTRVPADRITARDALKHPFLTLSDDALIDAGAGDDPARALAPAVITSVVSQQGDKPNSMHARKPSMFLPGNGKYVVYLMRLREFAARHELVRMFAQAVAFCVGRDEVRDLTKCFVALDRDQDGLVESTDIEVVLMGATEEEIAEEIRIVSRNSITERIGLIGGGGGGSSGNITPVTSALLQPRKGTNFFHSVDDKTKERRKRRREANYIFAALDITKKGKVSLNEFIAGTLDPSFYTQKQLLRDAFCRLCGAQSNQVDVSLSIPALGEVIGNRFNEKRARRLMGEFLALSREDFNLSSPREAQPQAGLLSRLSSFRLDEGGENGKVMRRVDADVISFEDFCKAMTIKGEGEG